MQKIMQILEPRSAAGIVMRIVFFIAVIAMANIAFSFLYHDHEMHDPGYYFAHAIVVGGPFVAFFFVVMKMQVKLKKRLLHLSRKDGLTGLNNRNTFFAIARGLQKATTQGVLLLLDADRFKAINDVHGHQTGDNCLKAVASTLTASLRDNDAVGRIGGEEFAIFLSDTTLAEAKVIAERFTRPIAFQSAVDDEMLSVTLSVGAVVARPDLTLRELMANADRGLYTAKANGRAQLVVWDEVAQPAAASMH